MAVTKVEDRSSSPSTIGKPSSASHHSSERRPTVASTSPAIPPRSSISSEPSVRKELDLEIQIDAEPGELWLSEKKGEEPWPVVICDEELLLLLVKGKGRPANALREDGTWRKPYRSGGPLAGQRCFPTLRLGPIMVLCWTPAKRLKPIDILVAKTIRDSTENPELEMAYEEAIEQHECYNPEYWKDKLLAQQLSDADAFKPAETKSDETKPDTLHALLAQHLLDADDFESVETKPNTLSGRNKRMLDESPSRELVHKIAGVKLLKSEESSTSADTKPAKKPRIDGNSSDSSFSSQRHDEKPLADLQAKVKNGDDGGLDVIAPTWSTENVTLYVGSPHKHFVVSGRAVQSSTHLRAKVSHDSDLGWYVMSPLLAELDPTAFMLVADVLDGQDTLNIGSAESVEDLEEAELLGTAMVHHIAERLGIRTLAKEAIVKLGANMVLPTMGFLYLVEELLAKGAMQGDALRRMFVDRLV